ncbi:MAG: integrase [Gammaproteobacteria bacterium RIFCSPHIGHO2_12_FULL_38_11]|nr:MAG: integrase [Gammaproteobacteria bacterium RIFCSPHIGHO2_12_FULL_38_11]
MNKIKSPLPLFDSLDHIKKCQPPFYLTQKQQLDFSVTISFLKSYTGSLGTFNSYRRDVERFLHWCWLIEKNDIKNIKRDNIESFIRFCQKPPTSWIGTKKSPRFINKNGERIPNPEWRPFVVTLSKAAHRTGEKLITSNFDISSGSIKELLAIISTFYNFLLQEEYVYANPVALIRQKSKFIRQNQGQPKIRRLSELQWQYVIVAAQKMAEENPDSHERTLFIMSALYSMYLRISELSAVSRWAPVMNHFERDSEGNWWFTTVGKGNKERQIAVSDAMLKALKRWRRHLGLSILPSPADNSSLLPRTKGKGPITNTSYIRKIVQGCFDNAMSDLSKDGFTEEAESLIEATVHWLRHTGISDDVKIRPREHVRDDAGHSSSATTDQYIDIELRERHRSAKKKPIFDED